MRAEVLVEGLAQRDRAAPAHLRVLAQVELREELLGAAARLVEVIRSIGFRLSEITVWSPRRRIGDFFLFAAVLINAFLIG